MVSSVKVAHFRFYAELNAYLPPNRRAVSFPYRFSGGQSVGSLIEELGVPPTEVRLVLVNGLAVDLSQGVDDGDRVSVYSAFRSIGVIPD